MTSHTVSDTFPITKLLQQYQSIFQYYIVRQVLFMYLITFNNKSMRLKFPIE